MRRLAELVLVLALIGSSVAPFLSVKANPYGVVWPEEVPAPSNVNLIVKMASPTDDATYSNGTISVCFNVTLDDQDSIADSLYMAFYKGDWMQKSAWCPFLTKSSIWHATHFLQFDFSITGVPFGKHSLDITPTAQGTFIKNGSAYHFSLNRTVSVEFSVRSNPVITFPSAQNVSSTNSSFPLSFTVDHPVSEMAYRLDGQESVSISGNTTLTGLSNGQHNVTVYATDEFGNAGTSNTLFFNVYAPESFPVAPMLAAFVAAVVVPAAGLLIYFKKRGRGRNK